MRVEISREDVALSDNLLSGSLIDFFVVYFGLGERERDHLSRDYIAGETGGRRERERERERDKARRHRLLAEREKRYRVIPNKNHQM